jgi:decaprenylphospho-beta-D-ribofuranose 2-oxidase
MSTPAPPLPGIRSGVQKLGCYSGLYFTRARVYRPTDIDQLRRIFARARKDGRRVTLRGGAHAFDSQSLGEDMVVSMTSFDSIEVRERERRIHVGPGATWGAIVEKLKGTGLVPRGTVTTAHATGGGTLAGDCLSRFSPAYGKEGEWIKSFKLLKMDGELLVCTPPDLSTPPSEWSLGERAFLGVIGGLGYLGAVVAITYSVLHVGDKSCPIGLSTMVEKYTSYQGLADHLVPTTSTTYGEESDPRDPAKLDAIWSALYSGSDENQSALLFKSRFTFEPDRDPLLLHRPDAAIRVPGEWLMRRPFWCKVLWNKFYSSTRTDRPYKDDLENFLFFMDGNRRAKEVAGFFGFNLETIQQTFVVPSDPDAAGSWDRGRANLVLWLERAHGVFNQRKLTPTLLDVLFLPKDLPFLLSASAAGPGFAVSYAFETSNANTIARTKEAFIELADILWDEYRGRVYLVKNVHAKQSTLLEMYGLNAVRFFRLKRDLDPEGLLRNEFLERTFGELLEPEGTIGAGGWL